MHHQTMVRHAAVGLCAAFALVFATGCATTAEYRRLEREVRGLQAIRWDARAGRGLVEPGTYRARLAGDDEVAARAVTLRRDPTTLRASAAINTETSR